MWHWGIWFSDDLAMLGGQFDSMILEIFSNQKDFMILSSIPSLHTLICCLLISENIPHFLCQKWLQITNPCAETTWAIQILANKVCQFIWGLITQLLHLEINDQCIDFGKIPQMMQHGVVDHPTTCSQASKQLNPGQSEGSGWSALLAATEGPHDVLMSYLIL